MNLCKKIKQKKITKKNITKKNCTLNFVAATPEIKMKKTTTNKTVINSVIDNLFQFYKQKYLRLQ